MDLSGRLLSPHECALARAALATRGQSIHAYADEIKAHRTYFSAVLGGRHIVRAEHADALTALLDEAADAVGPAVDEIRARRLSLDRSEVTP